MGALATLRAIVPLVVGMMIGVFGANIFASIVTIPAARESGRTEERVLHAEQLARAEAKARVDRDAAQASIDAAEREFYERDKARALQMSALEQALEKEQADAPIPPAADRSGVCRPAVTRRVRDALQGPRPRRT